jgi:hypothetical protein
MSYFSIEKVILKIQKNHLIPRHISQLKNNSKNSSKIYYNSLKIINGEFSQHEIKSCHLSGNSKKYIYF